MFPTKIVAYEQVWEACFTVRIVQTKAFLTHLWKALQHPQNIKMRQVIFMMKQIKKTKKKPKACYTRRKRSKPIRLLEKINQLKLPRGTVADYEKNPEIKKIYPAKKEGGTIEEPEDSLGRDLRELAAQKKICSNPLHSRPRLFWAIPVND